MVAFWFAIPNYLCPGSQHFFGDTFVVVIVAHDTVPSNPAVHTDLVRKAAQGR